MKTFADNAARTWAITVNVAAIKRVRELLAVNILEIADSKGKLLERLVEDPCLLCDVLWCLVKPEAEAKGISDEEFGRALGGDALDQATDALLTEIADFFPRSRREVLRRILKKLSTLQDKASALAMTKLDDPDLDVQLEREMTAALETAWGTRTKPAAPPKTALTREIAPLPSIGIDGVSSLPESPGSIQSREPCAS
jgi:hypothetical protein